ncbi:DUF5131 family protein [Bosea sp. (in: a-proteobacteria)]|uniref:DUF5131 family protein n=1 Tax=Bosea sp. (in: a-proteobacteria) TaxID=1871050 RepID=UPI001AC3284A|nr:phage Gp37/Gp68 family protein [Bosea sp. (in: a-proteobacteria)]MBN9443646.1 phage Gp37/Gp68 family protein [Bosea sp. (in: a-proteobacteria)]
MSDRTKIEWTDATWNPITGCSIVSPGCTNCYAMKLAGTRLQHHPSRAGLTRETKAGPVWNGTLRFNEEWLTQPLHWKRPRMIFVCAHGDLGHPGIPARWLVRVFAVMLLGRHHTYQVLTKRPERLREWLSDPETPGRIARMAVSMAADGENCPIEAAAQITYGPDPGWQFGQKPVGLVQWPLPNVWLGVSAEDQKRANDRVVELLRAPAAIRFVSAEPLLGAIDFTNIGSSTDISSRLGIDALTGNVVRVRYIHTLATWPKLDWIIVGGENGPREMRAEWAQQIRDQCAVAGTAFFFKQWGSHIPAGQTMANGKVWAPGCGIRLRATKAITGRMLDGVEHNAMPHPTVSHLGD